MATTTTTVTTTTANGDISLGDIPQDGVRAQLPGPAPATGPEAVDDTMKSFSYPEVLTAGFSFFFAGINDGSIGSLIPYLIRDYDINTAVVSSIYGASLLGWLLAALTNTHLSQPLGIGSMMLLGALAQILAHALRAWRPPLPLYVATFCLVALGPAYNDTHANTFVASLRHRHAHRWIAFIHAMYMAGCLVGPLVSTAVAAARTPSVWYLFYAFPLGLGVANLVLVGVFFRDTVTFSRGRGSQPQEDATTGAAAADGDGAEARAEGEGEGRESSSPRSNNAMDLISRTLREPAVWLLSLFYFFYLGSVVTAGGWVVEYLIEVREGDISKMGYVSVGYSGGALLGRLLLPEPTHRFGERRMIFIYSLLCIVFQLLFWLVPNIIAASVAVSFFSFFSGPFFATGISIGSKLFHPDIHATALALIFLAAQIGGSLFPVITGVIAASAGVAVLQPILLALIVATSISWLLVPRPKDSGNTALHQE